MIEGKIFIITLAAMLISLFLISTTLAQDSLLINYQGYLTDAAGDPITGNRSITFTIYDPEGVSLWSEEHSSVPVINGFFNVTLGSAGMRIVLGAEWSGSRDNFLNTLGITVESDEELVPRTPLTSVFHAGISTRVAGDIKTAPGILEIYSPDPCVPPDPCEPALEMAAEPDKNIIRVYPPEPCVPPEPCYPAFEVVSKPDSNYLRIGPYFRLDNSGDNAGSMMSSLELTIFPQALGAGDICSGLALGLDPDYETTYMRLGKACEEKTGPGIEMYTNTSSDGNPPLAILGTLSDGLYTIGEGVTFGDQETVRSGFVSDETSNDSTWTNTISNGEGSRTELHNRQGGGHHNSAVIAVEDGLTQLTLLNGDPVEPPDIVVQATTDGGGQIGINTDSPEEALDVNGTTKTTSFKMPTGAANGHVLTSDADGNGTWQAPASETCCGASGEFDGEVNVDMIEDQWANTTIYFDSPFTSTEKPHFYINVVLKGSANGLTEGVAIKAVEDIKGSAGNWTGFDITVSKYSDGSSIDDTTPVYVAWMAIGRQ